MTAGAPSITQTSLLPDYQIMNPSQAFRESHQCVICRNPLSLQVGFNICFTGAELVATEGLSERSQLIASRTLWGHPTDPNEINPDGPQHTFHAACLFKHRYCPSCIPFAPRVSKLPDHLALRRLQIQTFSETPLELELGIANLFNNVEKVREILLINPIPPSKGRELLRAAQSGDTEIVQLLLTSGDIRTIYFADNSSCIAINNGITSTDLGKALVAGYLHTNIMDKLLNSGRQIPLEYVGQALVRAAESGSLQSAQFLMDSAVKFVTLAGQAAIDQLRTPICNTLLTICRIASATRGPSLALSPEPAAGAAGATTTAPLEPQYAICNYLLTRLTPFLTPDVKFQALAIVAQNPQQFNLFKLLLNNNAIPNLEKLRELLTITASWGNERATAELLASSSVWPDLDSLGQALIITAGSKCVSEEMLLVTMRQLLNKGTISAENRGKACVKAAGARYNKILIPFLLNTEIDDVARGQALFETIISYGYEYPITAAQTSSLLTQFPPLTKKTSAEQIQFDCLKEAQTVVSQLSPGIASEYLNEAFIRAASFLNIPYMSALSSIVPPIITPIAYEKALIEATRSSYEIDIIPKATRSGLSAQFLKETLTQANAIQKSLVQKLATDVPNGALHEQALIIAASLLKSNLVCILLETCNASFTPSSRAKAIFAAISNNPSSSLDSATITTQQKILTVIQAIGNSGPIAASSIGDLMSKALAYGYTDIATAIRALHNTP